MGILHLYAKDNLYMDAKRNKKLNLNVKCALY